MLHKAEEGRWNWASLLQPANHRAIRLCLFGDPNRPSLRRHPLALALAISMMWLTTLHCFLLPLLVLQTHYPCERFIYNNQIKLLKHLDTTIRYHREAFSPVCQPGGGVGCIQTHSLAKCAHPATAFPFFPLRTWQCSCVRENVISILSWSSSQH